MIRSIRSMRPTSVALCIAAALALCLAVALAVIEAVPAHAQEGPDGLPVKPVITVGTDQTSIPEGTRAIYTLTRTGGDLTQPLTVSLVVTDLGQFMRGNYSLSPPAIPNHVTFRANSASAILELLARDDLRDIPDNILRVSLLPDSDYTIGGSGHAEVLVEDGDVAPEISLSVSEASVVEGTDLTFTLRRMGNTDNPVTVAMKTGPVGNTVFGLHRIEKNTTEITKTIRTEDDDLDEADVVYEARIVENDDYFDGSEYRESEYFTVAGERRATATVTDNDPQRVGIRAVWGEALEGRTISFNLVRAGQTNADLIVYLNVTQVGAAIPADQTGPRTVTIEAGRRSLVIPFDITGDDGDEPDGSISIEVLDRHDSNYAINPLQTLATTIVRDGDPDPVLAIGDETVSEGDGTIDFEVSYGSGPASQRTITVDYATRDNRAADGRDYTAASGTLTFLPGVDRTATISVPVIQDQSAERTETFYLTLSNPSNATLEDREPSITVVGTIEDDEPVVSIAASVESVPEGQRAVFELTRTGDITGDLTVRIGGSVYNRPISGSNLTASFPAGVSTAQWSYPTVDDSYNSPDYWVNVHVLNPSEFDAPNPQPESTEGVALQ